jgi:hypothetical protein
MVFVVFKGLNGLISFCETLQVQNFETHLFAVDNFFKKEEEVTVFP